MGNTVVWSVEEGEGQHGVAVFFSYLGHGGASRKLTGSSGFTAATPLFWRCTGGCGGEGEQGGAVVECGERESSGRVFMPAATVHGGHGAGELQGLCGLAVGGGGVRLRCRGAEVLAGCVEARCASATWGTASGALGRCWRGQSGSQGSKGVGGSAFSGAGEQGREGGHGAGCYGDATSTATCATRRGRTGALFPAAATIKAANWHAPVMLRCFAKISGVERSGVAQGIEEQLTKSID